MHKIQHPSEADLRNYFEYLDELRDSGITNMFGAVPYLMSNSELDKRDANYVMNLWTSSFVENTTALKRVRQINKDRKLAGIT